jgi:cyclic beta-1,2-glucan synthetase
MATQQHPAFDPNSLLSASLPRDARRNEKTAPAASRGSNGEIGQLCFYAQIEARTWVLQNGGKSKIDLQNKLEEARKSVESRCQILRNMATAGHALRGDAELLTQNAALLQTTFQKLRAAMSGGQPLPQVVDGSASTIARVYAVATSHLRAVNYDFQEQAFEAYLSAIQEIAPLDMAELWELKPVVQLAALEKIAAAADQMDQMSSTVAAQMLTREEDAEVHEMCGQASMVTLVASLRAIEATEWRSVFERVNVVEQILRKDPCGAYARMDFESRENYRRAVSDLAKGSKRSEKEVAQAALDLAGRPHVESDERVKERKSHVGYYLVAQGKQLLARQLGYRRTFAERLQDIVKHWPDFTYILGIEVATFVLIAAALLGAGIKASGWFVAALFLLPAAECAVSLVNLMATTLFPAKMLPKLDFSSGIPADCATMVVVPTLLTSETQMLRTVRDLEVRFLANRAAHLHFALLTDPPDSNRQFDERDALAEACVRLIRNLNEKYARDGRGSFFLFHRHRAFNPAEGIWMGWERKRGKLLDFNKLLLGTEDNFPVKDGNLAILREIKYVITLDLDTQLPRDAARRMVGAIAHPLNRAVINPATNTVVDGYGILQPRVEISIQSANRSRLAAVFSADAGFDIYTRAVSDVYQDLFGEGSFTGKGIYEVATFQKVLEQRFPCNAILSHDMIEGSYARAGLVSDIEVIDDYPSHVSAFSRRKHRWVRGDWQIVYWLLPRVPDFFGKMSPNPLSIISRWKILDNLRRSLTEIATFVMLLGVWLFFPGKALYWTLVTLAAVALPTYAQFMISILRAGHALLTRDFWKNLYADFAISQANLFMRLACLCHQSLVGVDAVVRTMVRMTVTHERLLEWETAAQAEASSQKKSPIETYLKLTPWLSFFIGLLLAADRPGSFLVALPLLVLWGSSKPIVEWLSLPSRRQQRRMNSKDEALLRQSALRTWRLFREFGTADENWLVPDTVQEPPSLIVHRISTTNLGLLLNSRLAAMDLGFFTLPEFVADTEKTFDSIDRMPKENGQMYNWYDTRTLEPVKPRFISSVDNGNLVCSLWTVKQGCLDALGEPIFRLEQWQGVIDHLDALEEALRMANLRHPLLGAVKDLKQRAKELRSSRANWFEVLPSFEREIVALDKKLSEESAASEAAWWSHELYLRITHLQNLVYDFAPWLAPQFAGQRQNRQLQSVIESERLTLESLPRICTALHERLPQLLEQDDESAAEAHSTLQLLRTAVGRTISISASLNKKLQRLAERADVLVKGLDFKSLYEPRKKLLTIGFDAEEGRLSHACYAIFASEARAASFVAIAKGEIPQESWLSMERPYTKYAGERVLLSWTGTTFEYLMPMLWMKTYPNTTLDETTRAAVHCQQKFAKEHGIPWGMSEASCSKVSPDGHYHYQAFGVPNLSINPERSDELVVSPYSTFLALLVERDSAIENIRRMSDLGWLGAYGFFEAADYTASRVGGEGKFETVRCWLAHHQGMSLMAVANVLCNGSSQRRFHQEPMVAATERLLHEKVARTTKLEFPSEDKAAEPNANGEAKEQAGTPEAATLPANINTAA